MSDVALLDADFLDNVSHFPNLALMKLSSYNKAKGNNVELVLDYNKVDGIFAHKYDKIYLSKVFTFSSIPKHILKIPNLKYSGSGFGMDVEWLPEEIEHIKPDYTLYDIAKNTVNDRYKTNFIDYSIGFTTRGCFRKCPFCINRRFDKVLPHATISEFYDESKPKICLNDDNIFAFGGWEKIFRELMEINKPFKFQQGLDIRLLTKEKANILNHIKYDGNIHFAFDNIKDAKIIDEKLKLLRANCDKRVRLYVLCGFYSSDVNDIVSIFERLNILKKYWEVLPYLMRHENYKKSIYSGIYINLASWMNQPNIFKHYTFSEFCIARGNSPTKALRFFESLHPDIAKQYFHTNYYNISLEKSNSNN